MLILRVAPLLSYLVLSVRGATYSQVDTFSGQSFLSGFVHQAIPDPTHGRVNYVSEDIAIAQNLTFALDDHLIIRADHTTVLQANGPGRNSVRLMSNKQYTTHVSVWNVRHMPQGCATWPAIWEVGDDWPNQGEIDILEGVNDQAPNQVTLHTNTGCTMPQVRVQSGNAEGDNCDVAATNNAGCGVQVSNSNGYGPAFNAAGGGFYAMERTDAFVKVWFWSRGDPDIPQDVLNGASDINTDNWDTPSAFFPNTSCDIDEHFGPHNLIINLTLCGDWAGAVYGADGCPGDCVSFVNNNPEAFTEAYFDIQWLKVYSE
ncbi:laminarinase [Daedaleopsis nitida]|nr:laminarinase [Daedaleopsis nitida]